MVNTKPNKSTHRARQCDFLHWRCWLFILGYCVSISEETVHMHRLAEWDTNPQLFRAHSYTNHVNIVTTFLTDFQILCSRVQFEWPTVWRRECMQISYFNTRWRAIGAVRCIAESNTKPQTTHTHNAIESKWILEILWLWIRDQQLNTQAFNSSTNVRVCLIGANKKKGSHTHAVHKYLLLFPLPSARIAKALCKWIVVNF